MFQPVGGMDRIPYAFAQSLGEVVQYGSQITEIRKTSQGVSVVYKKDGVSRKRLGKTFSLHFFVACQNL